MWIKTLVTFKHQSNNMKCLDYSKISKYQKIQGSWWLLASQSGHLSISFEDIQINVQKIFADEINRAVAAVWVN